MDRPIVLETVDEQVLVLIADQSHEIRGHSVVPAGLDGEATRLVVDVEFAFVVEDQQKGPVLGREVSCHDIAAAVLPAVEVGVGDLFGFCLGECADDAARRRTSDNGVDWSSSITRDIQFFLAQVTHSIVT